LWPIGASVGAPARSRLARLPIAMRRALGASGHSGPARAASAVAVVVAALALVGGAAAQSAEDLAKGEVNLALNVKRGTPLYEQAIVATARDQALLLRDHPDLVHQFNPAKFLIDINKYEYPDPKQLPYRNSVIFQPCMFQSFDCCNDTYGTPQYPVEVENTNSEDFGEIVFVKDDATPFTEEASRFPDTQVLFDEECEDLAVPRFECLGLRAKRANYSIFPVCWDRNDTVDATKSCRAPGDGRVLPYCVEVAFSQTAFINECNNRFADDPHCGTFLEIHKPGHPEGDETILGEVKLRRQFTSGYRMSLLPTTYQGMRNRLLCRGTHEVWWVQRTRYNFRVENRKRFFVTGPECNWDFTNERYQPFRRLFDDDIVMIEQPLPPP